MLFRILPLLYFRLQYFLELVNFLEGLRVPILMPLSLLLRFLLYLLFDDNIVVFKATQGRLELYGAFLGVHDRRWYQHVRVRCSVKSIILIT